jgi:hypothetical protein
VTPTSTFGVTGPEGGQVSSFTPSSKVYTVTNSGTGTLTWTASVSDPWLSLSSTGGTLGGGLTAPVTVSVNAGVTTLLQGTYHATVTFDDGDNATDPIIIPVTVTVAASDQPILTVVPGTDLSSAGPVGGPFSPASASYTVSNSGGGTLDWTASANQNWVTVSPASGSLTGSQTATPTVSFNGNAAALAAGQYSATVTFTAGTTTVTRQVTLAVQSPVLSVSPQTAFASVGPEGGPFTPNTATYTVTNTGTGSLTWDATVDYGPGATGWLSLTKNPPANGNEGTLDVTLANSAGQLAGSGEGTTYTATIQFTGSGGTTSRTVTLTVYARPTIDVGGIQPITVAPPAGGMTIYINGTNFVGSGGTTRVFFTNAAGNPGQGDPEGQVTVLSNTLLAVVTPPHAAGTFDIYVQTSVPTSGDPIVQTSALATFTFAEPTLVIDSVNPAEGPLAGGTQVTITGSNLPNAGSAGPSAKLLSNTGTTLALSSATYNVYGSATNVTLDLSLLRGAAADYQNGPASISGTINYDPAVLNIAGVVEAPLLDTWYKKTVALNYPQAGVITFVISGGTKPSVPPNPPESTEVTTFDNQLTGGTHNANNQVNPFLLTSLVFNVVSANTTYAPVTITDLAMADSNADPFPEFDAQNGAVNITASSAIIQIEDQTINDAASTVDVDFNLFRPEGANLLIGPATIQFDLDYDQNVLENPTVTPSAQLTQWYGKEIQLTDNATTGVVTVRIADPSTKLLAEITTIDPNNPGTQLNPFPLGTLHFGVKTGANLNNVQPFEVLEGLSMLDKNGQVFPGAGGVGDVGTITVTNMPSVYFGPKAATVQSSTTTQIAATTPSGRVDDKVVDVIVVDNSGQQPGNYGFKANAFTYLQPQVAVTPATDFVTTGVVGGSVFDPANASYQVYNSGNGTLDWTVSADQPWVTLDQTSGSLTGTDADTVVVGIDATVASSLAIGAYNATLTFSAVNSIENVYRNVALIITGPPELVVTPQTGVEFGGAPGGPFSPASRAFEVYNNGGGTMNWTASVDAAWVDISPTSGTNDGTVQVTLNDAANQLPVGIHTATVTFNGAGTQQTRTVTLIILPAGNPLMVVTPETGLDASGPQGGMFLPSSQAYTVYNTGGGVLNYTVAADSAGGWISLLNATGQVVGGSNATVTATIDPTAAAALAASTVPYTAVVRFYDENPQTPDVERNFSLTVFNLAVTAPVDNAEFKRNQQVPITWTYTGPTNANLTVRIELLDAQNAVVDTLATTQGNANGTNTFTWTVPSNLQLNRGYKIRIQSTTDNRVVGVSDGSFSIVEPELTVLNPQPGDTVTAGRSVTISWMYRELGAPTKINETVDIFLYRGDTEILQIANDVPNLAADENDGAANTFLWNVPGTLPAASNYRIVFKSSDDETVLGETPADSGFQVVARRTTPPLGPLLLGLLAALIGLGSGGGGGGGGGPCFIATAAYGTPLAVQIDTLRQFRDMYMLSNPLGMAAADMYYHISPAIADVVAKYPVIAAMVRIVLVPIILVAKMAVSMPIPSMIMAALGTVMLVLRRLRRSRGKA